MHQGLRHRLAFGVCAVALVLAAAALAAESYTPDPSSPRDSVPEGYRWHSADIFADKAAWEAELAAVSADIPKLNEFKGRLGESGAILLDAQNATYATMLRLYKVYIYAQTLYDVDQGNSEHRTMQGRVQAVFPAFGEATSWMEPELLEIDPQVIRNFMNEEPELARLQLLLQRAVAPAGPHPVQPRGAPDGPDGQHALDRQRRPRGAAGRGHGVPVDHRARRARRCRVTVSGFTGLRSNDNYLVRKQAADAFFGTLRKYENTFSVLLDGAVKNHIMTRDARGYDSCLEASLAPDNISTDAYRMLIDTVRANLPRTMHKYVELRRKVLGLDGPLTFPNLYNAMLEGVEPEYTYDEARTMIAEGLKPLGKEYVGLLGQGMDPGQRLDRRLPQRGQAQRRLQQRRPGPGDPPVRAAQLRQHPRRGLDHGPRDGPRPALGLQPAATSRRSTPATPRSWPRSPRPATRRC